MTALEKRVAALEKRLQAHEALLATLRPRPEQKSDWTRPWGYVDRPVAEAKEEARESSSRRRSQQIGRKQLPETSHK